MNPLNDTKEHLVDPIYISTDLFLKIKGRGYNIFAVVGFALESYRYYFHISRNLTPNSFTPFYSDMLQSSKNKKKKSKSFVIELTGIDPNVMLGFLAYKTYNEYLSIEYISISKDHQRKGLGTLLMNCAIDIAKNLKLKVISLFAFEHTVGFYEKLGMVGTDVVSNASIMELEVDYSVVQRLNVPKYLDIALSYKQQLSRIPPKKII